MVTSPAPAPLTSPGPILGEVVVRLGDRVIDVQHVGQRPEPAISRAGLFTIGACAASLGLWLVASDLAAVAAHGPDASLHDTGRERSDGAPTRGGAAGLGALLILLGVIPAAIAAGRPRPVPTDRYMIGEGPDVHLPVSLPVGLERAGMPLLLALERQLVLGLVPGMTGEIRDDARTLALPDLLAQGRKSYALPAGARCEAALGPLRFEIQAVAAERHVPARRPVDRLYWASNLGSLLLIGGVLLLAEPPPPGQLAVEEVALHRARAQQILNEVSPPAEPPPPPPPRPERPSVPKNRSEKPAARPPAAPPPAAAPPELAIEVGAGHPIAPKGSRRGIRDDRDPGVRYSMLADETVDGMLNTLTADVQESMLAFRDSAEDRKMWNDVLAAPVIERPFGGLTLAETERGGGVHADRPRPAKTPAKALTIDGNAPVKGPSAEDRALARRVFKITLARPFVRGAMNPQTVQEEVRKQELGLRNCFKAAVGTSDRVGTVIFRLQVAGSGRVSAASLDYGGEKLGDIGPCVSKMARSWRFPAPTDDKPATVILEAIFSASTH